MDKPFFAQSLQDMTAVFDELLASLSTLKGLGGIEFQLNDEGALLRAALATLVENYGVERCSVYLVEGERLLPAAGLDWQGWSSEALACGATPQGQGVSEAETGLMAEAVRTGEPQLTGCTDCLVSAPITAGGSVIGVVNMAHPEPDFFSEWHRRLLPLFGGFLGQILTANRLLHRMEKEVRARTEQLESVLEETRLLKQHYRNLALVDELTGLYNRRYFFSESRMTLSRAMRYRHPYSLLLMDLDLFKIINDTYGHARGDQVLKDVSAALLAQLRETDVLARVGGEEFAISMPETDREGALILADRLLLAVRELKWDEGEIRTTLSIGVSSATFEKRETGEDGPEAEDLLHRLFDEADRAMYRAKEKGGDRVLEGTESV